MPVTSNRIYCYSGEKRLYTFPRRPRGIAPLCFQVNTREGENEWKSAAGDQEIYPGLYLDVH